MKLIKLKREVSWVLAFPASTYNFVDWIFGLAAVINRMNMVEELGGGAMGHKTSLNEMRKSRKDISDYGRLKTVSPGEKLVQKLISLLRVKILIKKASARLEFIFCGGNKDLFALKRVQHVLSVGTLTLLVGLI